MVLGGGLTGFSYAYGMLKNETGSSATLIEKSKEIGGLMKSFRFNNFLFDSAPHIFRSKDQKVMRFVKNLLYDNYHYISSTPAIFKYGKLFDNVIPVITRRNVEALPNGIREKIRQENRNLNKTKDLSNFKSCIISQIGQALYWEFFGEYSKKWWGTEPEKLSSDLCPKNLEIGKEKSYGHITTNFEKCSEEIYPVHGGIFEIVKTLANEVKKFGGEIVTNSKIKSLECDGDEIVKIISERDSKETEIRLNKNLIVSTIPLTNLCKMLRIGNGLTYRADICLFIKLKRGKKLRHSWIYFHDSDVIFGRIYEPLYYSRYNAPKGFTSLCVEITCFENDKVWKDKYLGEKVIKQLLDLGIVKMSQEPEVLGMAKYAHAYPLYTFDYKQRLKEVFDKLIAYKNLKVIGRTGNFSYLNMWECLKWAAVKRNH